jgi:hypothetical protein
VSTTEEFIRGQFVVRRRFGKWRVYERVLVNMGMAKADMWRATFALRADAVNFAHCNLSHAEALADELLQRAMNPNAMGA